MVLYHGTNEVIASIDLTKSRNRTDFGKGFYLTDKIGTAQNWALSRAELRGGVPTILKYIVNTGLFTIDGARFDNYPTSEWLIFIAGNRKTERNSVKEPRHEHHWVSGSIADDKIADVVDDFLAGDISADEAIQRAKILPQTYQLSLHTRQAIEYVNDAEVSYRLFKNGKWSKNWMMRTV